MKTNKSGKNVKRELKICTSGQFIFSNLPDYKKDCGDLNQTLANCLKNSFAQVIKITESFNQYL